MPVLVSAQKGDVYKRQPLMEIAHHIEDLFFYIRENGLDALSESHKNDLFNLMFQSTDALRGEVEKLENDEPLSTCLLYTSRCV